MKKKRKKKSHSMAGIDQHFRSKADMGIFAEMGKFNYH